jgi:hypothetical protein
LQGVIHYTPITPSFGNVMAERGVMAHSVIESIIESVIESVMRGSV